VQKLGKVWLDSTFVGGAYDGSQIALRVRTLLSKLVSEQIVTKTLDFRRGKMKRIDSHFD